MTSKPLKAVGEEVWKTKIDKVNAELVALTYGSLVAQLCRDFENNYDRVNEQLDKMGYNIGLRLIEDFLARSGIGRCSSFKDTAEVISKVGFKMFLNVVPRVSNWSADGKTFSLYIDDNPLADFVELPPQSENLWYSNIYCGVLRGALEMTQMQVHAEFVSDVLQGHAATEIKVQLLQILKDEIPAAEE
ncbi:hypothetical protein CANCADRAFT_2296 [Tortispora caseinolytica NRRL Y-17796]|uniref:Trafficking protein particle complex subunit BET3 n=1 Tax=Tortispora caseinolytica NRRL Y-17796 TaxID=767744 RepID=A0A1E4TFP0_9ASCO|nr:hypothetical protein CANCADRAFT_2296 [Tortispora caseinolytica NRRL Y-17796]